MTAEKKQIIDKEKCNKLMSEICQNRRFYAYIHKVMINTYEEYQGLNKVIELDDFKSECFIKIYKSLDLFDESKSSLKNFCILCIKSTALQELRKSRSVRNKLKYSNNVDSLERALDNDGDCSLNDIIPAKDDEYFFEDFKKEVMEAINKLSPREKEVMLLRLEGFKTGQIAEMIITTSNNVTNRLAKARNKLRQYLNINK